MKVKKVSWRNWSTLKDVYPNRTNKELSEKAHKKTQGDEKGGPTQRRTNMHQEVIWLQGRLRQQKSTVALDRTNAVRKQKGEEGSKNATNLGKARKTQTLI